MIQQCCINCAYTLLDVIRDIAVKDGLALLKGRPGQIETCLQVLVPMVRIGRLPIVQKDMLLDVVMLTDVLEQHHIIVCILGTVLVRIPHSSVCLPEVLEKLRVHSSSLDRFRAVPAGIRNWVED